ncbi:porin [soil metagenome]
MARTVSGIISGGALAGLFVSVPSPAMAQAIAPDEAAALRAQIGALKAQVNRLEARLDGAAPAAGSSGSAAAGVAAVGAASAATQPPPQAETPVQSAAAAVPAMTDTKIGWKGAPQFTRGDRSFKVKGRIQMDAAYVAAPSSVNDRATGFSNEVRRIRLGAEGLLGGGFGYKLETELSDNSVDLVDTYVTYEHGKWLVTLGNHNQFQSLDELIGDTTGSVMERAAFTDAFGFERRLGLSVQYRSGPVLAQGGIFSDSVDSLTNANDGPSGGDENNSFGLDGRLVYAPVLGATQLHLAGSYHWRDFNRLSETPQRYRQRPFVHSVNSRFLSTPAISADGEAHYGLEAAGVRGPLHFAGEAHWLRVSRIDLADPTFFGAYAEVGYFLTKGDTRSYKSGIFGGADPKHPVGAGGIGAIQVNLRYDYLDMNDAGIVGGQQNAYLAAIIWTPINYLRFNLNYGHIAYQDAAILAGTRRDYAIDLMGVRAELDF